VDVSVRDELVEKLYTALREAKEEGELEYYLEVC
jgi:hypothetical protein